MASAVVLDLSHHNVVTSLRAAEGAGIVGIIHKATQGVSYKDPTYETRRAMAKEAGLLWGAYHFGTSADVERQVTHFLRTAAPEPGDLLCLDFEDNKGGQMTLDQAREFLRLLAERSGRMPVLYTGHTLKDQLGGKIDGELGRYRLWLPQYGPRPVPQASWPQGSWLWQFSDRGTVPGITGPVDVNAYTGPGDLRREWAGGPSVLVPAAPVPRPEPSSPIPPPPDDPGPPLVPTGQPEPRGFWARLLRFFGF